MESISQKLPTVVKDGNKKSINLGDKNQINKMLEPEIRLRQSIIDGNLLVVKRLLKRFPDLLENIDSSNGWSSLHYAAFNGRYLICVHLISLGHDKNESLKTFKKNTSVHLALKNGHEQTTHLLLQHFPKLLDFKGEDGLTPLHVSTIGDYYKCVEMLLTIGADLKSVDNEGDNSLHLAMKYGSLQSIRILINYGIDVNLKNNNGLKPIDVASSFQVEKFYHKVLNSKDDVISSPMIIDEQGSSNSTAPTLSTPILGRTHSNSLPPLPSVTTARRPSNASSITRSPIPRSAISLGFMGSNTNSYTFSPTSTTFSPQISIKPPNGSNTSTSSSNFTYNPSSSPVLVSPISGNNNGLITSAIVEEGQSSGLVNSASLSSFPSMTSLSSGKNTPIESRTRASSNNQITLPALSKSRSNSSTFKNVQLKSNPGKISPPNNSSYNNLSRTSTSSSIPRNETTDEQLEKKQSNTSSVLSNFFDNDVRNKLNSKLENVSNDFKSRTGGVSRKSSGSILNIPIASLRRKE